MLKEAGSDTAVSGPEVLALILGTLRSFSVEICGANDELQRKC